MFKKYLGKFSIYVLGMLVLSFAVTLILRSGLGSGSWDAFNANFSELTKGKISIGRASQITGLFFLTIILLYRRQPKYLLSLVPIFISGFFIDLWNLVILKNFILSNIYLQILGFIGGTLLLPLGLSIMIQSKLATMVYDEITYILVDVTKMKSFAIVRIFFELFAIVLAIIFGLIAGIGLGEVNLGTVIISFFLGPIITMWNNIFDLIFKRNKENVLLEEVLINEENPI